MGMDLLFDGYLGPKLLLFFLLCFIEDLERSGFKLFIFRNKISGKVCLF